MSKRAYAFWGFFAGSVVLGSISSLASAAFEGHIRAVGGRGSPTGLLYTIGTNYLRVEMTETNFPNAIDVVDLKSGQLTLIQPMNRTFVRFNPASQSAAGVSPGFPGGAGGLPPGIGPRTQPGNPAGPPAMPVPPPGIGPTNFPGMPAMPTLPGGLPAGVGPQAQPPSAAGALARPELPARPQPPDAGSMPAMPIAPPSVGLELKATGESTNLLGYTCERYEIKGRGQTMEIWATDQLVPFQVYLSAQPPGFGPPMIEREWSALLSAKKLFPLRAVLTAANGVERYRFEVQSIKPGKLTKAEAAGFQPPEGYVEMQPRPF
jgi:hypothetical protein